MPYTDDNIITKKLPNYCNLHLNMTDNTTLVNNICKALCDWLGYVCMGYEFTNGHANDTFKKDSASFLNSENIDRSSNKLANDLSINEVCSNSPQN